MNLLPPCLWLCSCSIEGEDGRDAHINRETSISADSEFHPGTEDR